MSAFHDEVFSEINSARKLVAEFKRRPYGNSDEAQAARFADDEDVKVEDGEKPMAIGKEVPTANPDDAKQPDERLEAEEILRELAEARARERAIAEESLRKASGRQEGAAGADPEQRETAPADPVRYFWFPGIGDSHVWYFTAGRERCGPVSFKDLRTMAASGVLDPRRDMVWKKGMPEWKQAGLLDGLFERNLIKEEVVAAPPPRTAPVKPLRSSSLLEKLTSKKLHWPGMGRRFLVPGILLFPLLWNQLLIFANPFLGAWLGAQMTSVIHPSLAIVPPVVLAFMILNRLDNVGMNRWWSLAIMIPLLNLWVAFLCLFCPAGYAYHRKMDRAGLIMIAVLALVLPFTWQNLGKHPVASYGAYLQTGIRAVVKRAEKEVLPYL
jgi:hypothetical protein